MSLPISALTGSNTINQLVADVNAIKTLSANSVSPIFTGTVTAQHFDNVSDIRLKENIISITETLQIIDKLNPVSFNFKTNTQKTYGLIAQEVEKILPDIVHQKDDDGTKTISYIQLIPLLISVIKDQQKQINDINTTLTKII